MTNNHKQDTHN